MPNRRPPKARRPGRPAQAPGDLRERLLDSALACFARASIGSTTLAAIARQAGVTPALVHYYFDDKPALVQAVVQERVLPATAGLREAIGAPTGDTGALVAGFVVGIHAVVARHPWLPALWVREILTEGGALREVMLSRVAPAVPQVLAQRFAQAQGAGAINPALDPRLLVVSLVGLTLFPLAAEGIWQRMFPDAGLDRARLLQHTLALLGGGLETRHAS
jgi:TetR/AcrR family transcriptional regulator